MCKKLTNNLDRNCLICEKSIFGRADKVFCGIQCKNKYHSEVRRTTKSISSETFKILNRNWTIITNLMTDQVEKIIVKKLTLQRLGFDFSTITNIHQKNMFINFGIYNYTYYIGKNDNVIIFKDKEHSEISPFIFKRLLQRFPIQSH